MNGLMWKTLQTFASTGLSFFFMIFMTRLLTPDDYGLIGMLAVFIALSQAFIDSGFGQALVRKQDITSVDESTVFYFNVIASALCYIILYIAAPFISSFYEMPILSDILRLQGIILIISSLSSIQALICSIKLDFKTPTYVGLISSFLSGILGIIIAHMGYGVWALVWQQILLAVFTTIAYYVMTSWKPTWEFSYTTFREMFSFGSKLLGARLINIFYNKLAPIVIGKRYSAAELGLFLKSEQLASFPASSFMGIISGVSYPVLCQLQNDKERLCSAYKRFIGVTAFLLFPFMIYLSFYGEQLMVALFGNQWAAAGKYMEIMCIPWMTVPIQSLNLNLLQVVGRSDLLLRLEIIGKILGFSVLMIVLPISVLAVCIGYTVTAYLSFFINTYYTAKFIDYPLIHQVRDILRTILLSIFVVGVAYLITSFIDGSFIQLIVGFIIASILYALLAYSFKMKEYIQVIDLVKETIS